MKSFLPIIFTIFSSSLFAQLQTCPPNSNFADGTLTDWNAYTGNNGGLTMNGPQSIKDSFTTFQPYPNGTAGVSTINEYQLNSPGIQVLTFNGVDPFGGFSTVPTINGYAYNHSVLLGSTNITRNNGSGGGGYVRGIKYLIGVPVSPITQPYTMTYAYAMVLENGTHNSVDQPVFSATLMVKTPGGGDSVITCASPKYLLPTLGNAAGGLTGATLDSAAAFAEGFTPSQRPSPNENINQNSGFLRDVWSKGWTEVTFDLSPYRGQTVTLTFESDNCIPGGHFAYAYIALRNTCEGLLISGDTVACNGTTMTYSIPALGDATYDWTVPAGWSIVGGTQTNIIKVIAGSSPGSIGAHEVNGCADLRDAINVTSRPPTIPGVLSGDSRVCTGINSSPMTLGGYLGDILTWVSSTNGGSTWTPVPFTGKSAGYTSQNLTKTTIYEAVVQNGQSCLVDSSEPVTVLVDPKSVGGDLLPANQKVCIGQFKDAILTLSGAVGDVLNWQSSLDAVNYNDLVPVNTTKTYNITGLTASTDYRVIVRSGVCPEDTSTVAAATLLPGRFPQASAEPADTTICYGATATLNALITLGTSYSWTTAGPLTGATSGPIVSVPFAIQEGATPLKTTDYVLSITNAGCPNPLRDTFDVHVIPEIFVNAGNDTSVVYNQPLQLSASSNDPGDDFTWTPALGLNDPDIADPIGLYGLEIDTIKYVVKAYQPLTGCYGLADIVVKVFKTPPDIFVPNAFSPDGSSNKLFRPIPVGLSSIQYFRIYNRAGQLVFSTRVPGQGWDGNLGGRPQPPGGYVWEVRGTSYLGKPIFKKGVMVLVR
jgi:PKD-like domain/CHU_C Type IX secretion signal domain